MNATLQAALEYARRGWLVLPIHTVTDGLCSCRDSECGSPGKHPRTLHGERDASTAETTLRRWWSTWPKANIAVLTGPKSGVVALDVDPRNGGLEGIDQLEAKCGPAPETVSALTGGGGTHLFFEHPGSPLPSRKGFLPGLDLKADTGYVLVEPSSHPSGGVYTFEASSGPDDLSLAPLPQAWLELLRAGAPGNGHAGPVEDEIPEGKRSDTLTSLAGSMRRRGMKPEEIEVALMAVNHNRCRPPLSEEEVGKIARSIGRYRPGPEHSEAREGDDGRGPEREAEEEGDITLALYEPPPIGVLPEALRDFIQEEAQALGVDDAYMLLPSLATVAGAIGLSARVQLSPEWREPGLLWTALIAESGARKSPPFGHALEALWRLDDAERPGYQAAMKAFEQALEDYSNTSRKDRLNMEKPEPPLEPRVTASDITFEALIEVLSQHPRGILAHYDELGVWFASFDAYRGGKGGDAAKWRTMHDGGRVDCRRKNGTNIVLPRAGVAITGAIQPGALRALMVDRDGCPSPMVTGGTIGRFLLAAPPPAYAPAPRHGAVSQDTRARHFQAIRELALVQMGEDQYGNPSSDLLHLTPEAADRWYEFLKAWAETKRDTESSALKSAASKCEGRAARIALDLHCYDRAVKGHVSHGQADWGMVPLRWIEAGIQISCGWGWREAQRWYGAPDGLRAHQRPLVVWVSQRGGKVTVRDLARSGPRRFRGKTDASRKAFQELVDIGLGRWNPSAGSRAPSELFELNPNGAPGTGDRFHVPPQEYEESVSSSRGPDPETAEDCPAWGSGRKTPEDSWEPLS